jgi:DNA repair exonuclease SbcCD nuclease subunit
MTSLVHTADVHLRPDTDERLAALEEILTIGADRDADVLTIGGDLFDRPEDVEQLRTELRNRFFTEQPFEIILIPGNHDVEAFRGDLFFGDACTVIADEEYFGTWVSPQEDLRIIGIPYREQATDDLLLALNDREGFAGTDVLLFHGSLDAPIGADAGDEDDYRYFPVTEELLTELSFDYYLAGHYHGPHQLQFATGAEFAYPGTPASTRTSETGRRRVVRLDDDGLAFEPLDTFHYIKKRVTVTPGEEDAVITELDEWVQTTVSPNATPSVIVEGVIDQAETEFSNRLREVVDPDWLRNQTVSADHVTSHPVLQEFEQRLADKEWDEETKDAVWTRTLRVASEVASSQGFE